MEKIDKKIRSAFEGWLANLAWYMLRKGDDIAAYNEDILRELFANGYTTKKAYLELQSELRKTNKRRG